MARSAEMGMTEPDNRAVFMLVACAVFIDAWLVFPVDIVRNGIGIRAELYQSEGVAGPGEGVTHAVGADNGVDIRRDIAILGDRRGRHQARKNDTFAYFLDLYHLYCFFERLVCSNFLFQKMGTLPNNVSKVYIFGYKYKKCSERAQRMKKMNKFVDPKKHNR